MAGVERAGYMDSNKSSIITESIVKEKKLQRQYFKEQEAAGRIVPKAPTPPPPKKTLAETVGIPEHLGTLRQDPEQSMHLSISKNMWTSNPGYIVRDGPHMASTMKQDYVWDQEEIEMMKEQGYLDKKFNRRRDEFVQYVEASCKMAHLTKGPGAR